MGIFDKHFADADDDPEVQAARELIDLTIELHETKTANQALQEENARLAARVEELEEGLKQILQTEPNWNREYNSARDFLGAIVKIAKAALEDSPGEEG